MEKNNYLNWAIYNVITHKFKHDVKEAHEIVKKAGFVIEKWNGCYVVKKGEKYVYVSENKRSGKRYLYRYGSDNSIKLNGVIKFDFIGYFDKVKYPKFIEWKPNAKYKASNISIKKRMIKDATERIEKDLMN